MIKCDFGKETSICGSPVQIAAELEELMREIRHALCKSLGESSGMHLYEEIIRLSRLDIRQRNEIFIEAISKAERENPEAVQMASDLTDELMRKIFGVTTEGKKNGKY